MPLKNIQKPNQTFCNILARLIFPAQILTVILGVIFQSNSFAKDPEPNNTNYGSNIANILNKANNIKIPESDTTKNELAKTNNNKPAKAPEQLGGVSQIVSSLIPKKNNGPSLMFSNDEIEKIEQALLAYENKEPFTTDIKPAEKEVLQTTGDEINSSVYLGSILYHSPNSWAAWINGQKITNSDNNPKNELYIKSINPDKAQIVWTMSISKWKILADQKSETDAPIGTNNQVELNFNLSFNQTYILVGGKIIEGRINSAALKPIAQSENQPSDNSLKTDNFTKKTLK